MKTANGTQNTKVLSVLGGLSKADIINFQDIQSLSDIVVRCHQLVLMWSCIYWHESPMGKSLLLQHCLFPVLYGALINKIIKSKDQGTKVNLGQSPQHWTSPRTLFSRFFWILHSLKASKPSEARNLVWVLSSTSSMFWTAHLSHSHRSRAHDPY